MTGVAPHHRSGPETLIPRPCLALRCFDLLVACLVEWLLSALSICAPPRCWTPILFGVAPASVDMVRHVASRLLARLAARSSPAPLPCLHQQSRSLNIHEYQVRVFALCSVLPCAIPPAPVLSLSHSAFFSGRCIDEQIRGECAQGCRCLFHVRDR